MACGDGVQGAAGMFGGHAGGEVGGGFVVGFGLMATPVHKEAVGQPGEDAVDPHGVAGAQPALVVAARDIESGVEAVFDAPMVAVVGEPGARVEAPGWQAAEQCHGLGLLAGDFAAQARGLGGQWEADGLGGDRCALQDAGFLPAFVGFSGGGERAALGACFALPVLFSTRRRRLREKRRLEVPARGARWLRARQAGCL